MNIIRNYLTLGLVLVSALILWIAGLIISMAAKILGTVITDKQRTQDLRLERILKTMRALAKQLQDYKGQRIKEFSSIIKRRRDIIYLSSEGMLTGILLPRGP